MFALKKEKKLQKKKKTQFRNGFGVLFVPFGTHTFIIIILVWIIIIAIGNRMIIEKYAMGKWVFIGKSN